MLYKAIKSVQDKISLPKDQDKDGLTIGLCGSMPQNVKSCKSTDLEIHLKDHMHLTSRF